MKKALLILNGYVTSQKLLHYLWAQSSLRVCANGGYKNATKYGFSPDLVVGDLDSIPNEKHGTTKFIHLPNQHHTDAEKAISYIIEQGYQKIEIVGSMGNRLDHSYYNIGLLRKFFFQLSSLRLWNTKEKIWLTNKPTTLKGKVGQRISILPCFGKVTKIKTRGLVYPILDKDLELGVFASVSNRFQSETAQIDFEKGWVVIFQEHWLVKSDQ